MPRNSTSRIDKGSVGENPLGSSWCSGTGNNCPLSASKVFPPVQHFFRDHSGFDMVGSVVKLLLDLRYLRNTGIRNLVQYRFELTDLLIAAG
jgi:hypothetical protein